VPISFGQWALGIHYEERENCYKWKQKNLIRIIKYEKNIKIFPVETPKKMSATLH